MKTNGATKFNGDKIDGAPVITKLNVRDLEEGKIHRFMFKGADMNIGQSWYVPVMVAKGVNPGKKLLLITGIHGDELNGVRVIQQIFADLDPNKLSGSIIGVVQASPNSLLHITRYWKLSTDGGCYENMNRLFPGDAKGNTAEIHAYKLWHDLWHGNADCVVDLHTQSTDTEYPLFIYADYRVKGAERLAKLFPADQIINAGDDTGTVEDTFDKQHIPAITVEVGGARRFQPEYIARTVEGIHNVLIDMEMQQGKLKRTAKEYGTFCGDEMESVCATVGGYAEVFVNIGDMVKRDQKVALQRNPFGDEIAQYYAPISGMVVSINTSATREAGGLLVRILSD